ncbi:MAG TPA: hypothetical protein ENI27_09905, partial [bacterium]|nr:hypothetical protein [bacterium]
MSFLERFKPRGIDIMMEERKSRIFTIALSLMGLVLTGIAPAQAAEAANSSRRVVSLDGAWQMAQGDMNAAPAEFEHQAPVPGLADMAEPPFKDVGVKSPLRQAFWYKRTFRLDGRLPAAALLKIHKAKYRTKVILNGKTVGEHAPNFTPALLDVRPFLKDAGEENELIVRVGADISAVPAGLTFGNDKEKIRYIPGIYDSVELILTGKPTIVNIQTVPNIKTKQVRVVVELAGGVGGRNGKLNAKVSEAVSGKTAGTNDALDFTLDADGKATIDFHIPIKDCRLWSPEDPFLYRLELDSGGDTKSTRFGMRSFRFDAVTRRAYLNGRPYYLRGTNVCIFRFFEDSERGDRPWRKEWVRRLIRKFKEMNWNSARYCIGFPPEIWYEIADEEGLLIQDEYPIWDHVPSVDNMTIEFTQWMRERWNHPCVVTWDAQNETTTEATSAAIRSVRHLDLSNRPWDNGRGSTLEPTDCWEGHPYLFINYTFPGMLPGKPPFRLSHLETSPDRAWRYGNEGGVPASQIINEYGWLWLNRDGSPTTMTDGLYQSLLGPEATVAQRRELFSRYLAALTEYWRSRRTCAGVQHFCGLGYSRPTEPRGQTSDHFIDMEKLILEPTFEKYVRDAFMPVGVCIDYWKEELTSGTDTMDVPVIVINDLGKSWEGKLTLSLLQGKRTLWKKSMNMKVDAVGKETGRFDVKIPADPAAYQLIAELATVDGNTVRSLRDINVVRCNLAQGKPVTASSSSNLGEQYRAENAVDGNMGTRWSSDFSDPQWIAVDLGAEVTIDTVMLHWEAAYGKSYAIEVSSDGGKWTEVYRTDDG